MRVLAGCCYPQEVAGQRVLPLRGVLPGSLLVDLHLREQPHGAGEQADRLQLGWPGQVGSGQGGQCLLDQGDRVGPGQVPGGRDVEQPRVAVVDGPRLMSEPEQVGDQLPGTGLVIAELAVYLVGHELHQLVPGGHVPVQGGGSGADGRGGGAHGHRAQAAGVGECDAGRRDLRAAVLGDRPPGRALRAGPDAPAAGRRLLRHCEQCKQ